MGNSCVMSEYVKMALFGSYLAVTGIFCPASIQPVKQGKKEREMKQECVSNGFRLTEDRMTDRIARHDGYNKNGARKSAIFCSRRLIKQPVLRAVP